MFWIEKPNRNFEIREGGLNHATHKIPGQSRWENIILKSGVSSDSSLMTLREMILNDAYDSASQNMMQGFSAGGSVGQLASSVSNAIGGGGPGASQPKRFNGSIVIKNNRMQEMVRYTFKDDGCFMGRSKIRFRKFRVGF